MERFRRIVVDNATYQWLFRYHGHDYHKKPYLLIVKEAVPDKSLKIEFSITDHFLLNSGLPAVFQSNQTVINLNRPRECFKTIKVTKPKYRQVKQRYENRQPSFHTG